MGDVIDAVMAVGIWIVIGGVWLAVAVLGGLAVALVIGYCSPSEEQPLQTGRSWTEDLEKDRRGDLLAARERRRAIAAERAARAELYERRGGVDTVLPVGRRTR